MWSARVRAAVSAFGFLPAVAVVVALLLGVLMVELDREGTIADVLPIVFPGGPDGARELLSSVITAMITLTALVFSITVVVLQLTSSQYSPRVLRSFAEDRINQATLAVFVATFVYAMTVLRSVRGDNGEGEEFVPQAALTLTYLLVVVSVAMFVSYIQHTATSIRASRIVSRLGGEGRALVERRHPAGGRPTAPVPDTPVLATLPATRPGVVVALDEDGLVALARRCGVLLELAAPVGDFVPEGATLFRVREAPGSRRTATPGVDEVDGEVSVATDRTLQQDTRFAFRQLVDIAERSLSPSLNDATTAIEALDECHDLLRRLAQRSLPPRVLTDDAGIVRLVVDHGGLDPFLAITVDEVVPWAAQHARVLERLRTMLEDLETVAQPQHRPLVSRRLARVVAAARRLADEQP